MNTTGYLNTKEGKDAANQINRMLKWDDNFYDTLPLNKMQKVLKSPEYNGIVYIEHSWKQLKKSMEWYEEQCKLVDYDADAIMREIELQRIEGNERSPFKKHLLMYITRNVREPIDEVDLSKNLCSIYIYDKINHKIPYILSVDPAEGLGLNNNAFTLINPYTQCAVAEFKSPFISPPDFFRLICSFMDKYCPRCLIVIEANRGRELINRFLESKYRYRLWYDTKKITAKVVEKTDEYGAQRQAANERRSFGFDTTVSSRPLLFSILEMLMMEQINKLNTKFIVKDITNVQRKVNGKIILTADDSDDDGVSHGDNLMSYLIGLFVYYNAENLEEYGIIRGASAPRDDTVEETAEEKIEKMKTLMSSLPPEMKDLFQSVINEKDEVKSSWEYQRQLQRELVNQEIDNGEIFNHPNQFPEYMDDDSHWNSLSARILDSNYRKNSNNNNDNYGYNPGYGTDEYGQQNNDFDVNNWI